jgi:TonB-dependent starch-binding outer membrane protein SusC
MRKNQLLFNRTLCHYFLFSSCSRIRYLFLLFALTAGTVLHAQSRLVSGKVTDEKGNPVANASVMVRGTTIGTTTNPEGNFSLSVPPTAQFLVVSYIGMNEKQIPLTRSTDSYQVNLTHSTTTDMQDVVVVAYGTQIKRNTTGAVASVNSSDLENRPFTSVDQMLQGQVPGLLSLAPTGQPGAAQSIRIRGIGSITAGASPLFVVDGIPINTGDFSRVSATSNTLAGINPNDIESVTVLKDAASASIYGSRAANGVVLITTKKGRAGKSKVRVDAEYGQSQLGYLNDLSRPLNREQYFDLTIEGLKNAGATQAQMDAILASLGYNNTYNEDWMSLVTRNGAYENVTASVSGGDQKTTFYTSAGYMNQDAVVITSDFKRYSGTINIRHKANDKLAISLNTTGSYVNQDAPAGTSNFRNPVLDALSLRPSQNAYNADGTVNISSTTFNQIYNPIAIDQYDKTHANIAKILGNIGLEYQIFRDLGFSSKFGLDYVGIEEEQYYNPFFGDARTVGGRLYNYYTRVSNWTWSNILNYKHQFLNNDLDMDFKVGYETEKNKEYRITARGESLPLTTLIPMPTPSSPVASSGFRTDYSFISMLSNLQFNYQSRYSLSGSFRRDGSSRFGPNNKYGNFWSVGAAWNIDQELFMKEISFINGLKLRGSYGVNGNADIGDYTWRGTYQLNSPYNQTAGSAPYTVENRDLTWEVNKPLNIGLDVIVWNNRVNLSADYYIRKTENLILNVPLSRTAGTSGATPGSVTANVGAMENKGWEFQLNVTPVRTKDFDWDVNFNIALNKNKVTSLPNGQDILTSNKIRRVGQDFQSIRTRLWAGVDPATGDPLWYVDSTRKATTNNVASAGRYIIGSASPKGFGGFGTDLSFKGFSLNAQFSYQYGNLVWDQWGFITWSDGFNPQLNRIQKQLGRWQKPGDITNIPKYVYGGAKNSNAESSRWYYKGDFIRLRDVTLSYTIPKSVLSRIKIDNARFFVKGSNLWTRAADKNITFDPEQPITGTSDLQIMIPKTVSAGVTLGF